MGESKTVLTVREWPVDLHRALRSKAARQGMTLRRAMIEASLLWLNPSLTDRERKDYVVRLDPPRKPPKKRKGG